MTASNQKVDGWIDDIVGALFDPIIVYLRISEQIGRCHGGNWPPCRRKVATFTEQIGRGDGAYLTHG